MPSGEHSRITHQQFFQVCEHVRAQREYLAREKPSLTGACELISRKCGFPVGDSTLRRAMEATGVDWERTRREVLSGPPLKPILSALADALIALYADLGKHPSLSLLSAQRQLQEQGSQQALLPLPT